MRFIPTTRYYTVDIFFFNVQSSLKPALNDRGECVGIAFQSLKHDEAENIGYIIPTTVIQHFIQDYERNGRYTGFPSLGIKWQKLENPDMREALGVANDAVSGRETTGVYINSIQKTSPEFKFLSVGDILCSFDGVRIANDGTVPFEASGRKG